MPPTALFTRVLAVTALLATAAAGAAQSGPLRERLRDRVADRMEQRVAAAEPATRLAAGQRIPGPGRYQIHLHHGGIERMALIHVPRGYRSGEPAPLVMALHGAGGAASVQANDEIYGLISKSEDAGFIAVFPNGVSPVDSGMLATWNAGACCAQARDRNIDDVGFLRALVADTSQRASIVPERVYAIGMSNGAMMAYRLACEASDVFHAIMAVAGTDNTRHCEPQFPVAVLHIHARDDDRVPYAGGTGRTRREELAADFTSVSATISKWVKLNHAASSPARVLDHSGAWCERHAAAAGGAPVQLCITQDGGHSWPGGSRSPGDSTPSKALRANDVMWDFFNLE